MASVGFSNGVLVITSLMVVVTLMLLTVFARLYRKAGPHEALVVYGFRGTRIVKGRGTVIFPMIENWHELSLELMSFDVAPQQDVYTRQGVAVTVSSMSVTTTIRLVITRTPLEIPTEAIIAPLPHRS